MSSLTGNRIPTARPYGKSYYTVVPAVRTSGKSNGVGFYMACGPQGVRLVPGAMHMDTKGSPMSLRLESANNHISGRTGDVLGYYCDDDGDGDTLQPIIARLPHSRGFLAGWTMGAGMASSLDGTVYSDAESAAYAAHSMAEHDAERERDRQANWRAENDDNC